MRRGVRQTEQRAGGVDRQNREIGRGVDRQKREVGSQTGRTERWGVRQTEERDGEGDQTARKRTWIEISSGTWRNKERNRRTYDGESVY